jgi:bifunctional UDP-N-acetylglucosamine pyrophosphorylase / glucosamine-1-phosphate N-acetyltransferase
MRSDTPKVLHPMGGRTLLGHALAAAAGLDPEQLVVVVRHGRDDVVAHLAEAFPAVRVADQDDVKGTGRAVRCGLDVLPPLRGTVVVTYGDVPLLETATLEELVDLHEREGDAVTLLSARLADPTGYGRVLRDDDGSVTAIVEQKDATAEQALVDEVNSGIYAFDAEFLRAQLDWLSTDNAAGEAYLTDLVAVARAQGRGVRAVAVTDARQIEGVNDRVQLATLGRVLRDRTLERWMHAGVTVLDPETTWVDADVRLEPDVTLLPGTHLHGSTTVARGATVGPDTTLVDCAVGEDVRVVRSHAQGARLGAGSSVGPYSFLRPGTVLGAGGRIGAYVETKNADIGAGSKVPHLSYVGDARIGEGTNIGAATVFVNYDGVAKHRTEVGDHVRIGSDTMLVAPVRVGDGAYTAAGSVVTDDVPPGALAVARARQRVVEGWVERRRAGSPSARAAAAARGRDLEGGTGDGSPADAGPSAAAPDGGHPGSEGRDG